MNTAFKALVSHLLKNNLHEILSKSRRNCHAIGMDSIVLLESPGKSIRLFVARRGHTLSRNLRQYWEREPLSVGFHPHHCNLTLHCTMGQFNNWNVAIHPEGRYYVNAYQYQSYLKDGVGGFRFICPGRLSSESEVTVTEGNSIYLQAHQMHTVSVLTDEAAWLVLEGTEDHFYNPVTYSNDDLEKLDTSKMYKPMGEADIIESLEIAKLL